jgi:hypothetical protein
VERYPGARESLDDLRSRIERCASHHEKCNIRDTSDFMPTRLLKITRVDDEYLVNLQMNKGSQLEKYAALSYSWGGQQKFCLKTSNLKTFAKSINFKDLPATLQDAVVATQNFGIQLLWIDALCIIQDDEEDKGAEISCMGAVYSLAYVTIVASRSRSVQEGFLFPRLNVGVRCLQTGFSEFSFRSLTSNGDIDHIVLTPYRIGRTDGEPLDERGWALQELVISPRIVRITQIQSRFICCEEVDKKVKKSDINVGEPKQASDKLKEYYGRSYYFDTIQKSKYSIRFDTGGDEVILNPILRPDLKAVGVNWHTIAREVSNYHVLRPTIEYWNNLVEAFTKRSLSDPRDRLLALSAIAQLFGEVFQDNYVAGMWGKEILLQLR